MRTHTLALISLLPMLLAASACTPEIVSLPGSATDAPTYLFRFVFQNHSWGAVHQEWIIGTDGNLYQRGFDDNDPVLDSLNVWQLATDTIGGFPYLSPEQMIQNLLLTTGKGPLVAEAELLKRAALIQKAASGEWSNRSDVRGYDMGGFTWYGYHWDETAEAYQEVMLQEGGTFERHNKSQAAKKLVRWLEGLKEE